MTDNALFGRDAPEDPALALFKQWDQILSGWGQDTMAYGRTGWGLQRLGDDNSVIGFGQMALATCRTNVYSYWKLRPDGRFKWSGGMWGWDRRSIIAEAVPFLDWSHIHGRYQWFPVWTSREVQSRWQHLRRWQSPVRYVSEDLLGCRVYRGNTPWCRLAWIDNDWKIVPARDTDDFIQPEPYQVLVDRWNAYEALVKKRYRKLENFDRIRRGLQPIVSERAPTVRSQGQTLTTDQSIERLVALLKIDHAAKITRPKEATCGTDNVAPAHQL